MFAVTWTEAGIIEILTLIAAIVSGLLAHLGNRRIDREAKKTEATAAAVEQKVAVAAEKVEVAAVTASEATDQKVEKVEAAVSRLARMLDAMQERGEERG